MDQRQKTRLARKGCFPNRKYTPNLFQKIIPMEMQRLHKPAKSTRKQELGFGVLVWQRNAAHKEILRGQSRSMVTGMLESILREATLRAFPFEPLTLSAQPTIRIFSRLSRLNQVYDVAHRLQRGGGRVVYYPALGTDRFVANISCLDSRTRRWTWVRTCSERGSRNWVRLGAPRRRVSPAEEDSAQRVVD